MTVYHPQANGLIERFHRTIKNALRCATTDGNWLRVLLWVLLGLRTTPRDDLGSSAAEVLLGTPLRVPGICFPTTNSGSPKEELQQARHNIAQFTPKTLNTVRAINRLKAAHILS